MSKTKRYVITCAQNATPAHTKALQALTMYCITHNAQLLVVPIRYKNPTSVWAHREKRDDWWDEQLLPHMVDQRVHLAPGLVLAADVKVQPTASSPLSGFEALTGPDSCIIGHPKMQLKYVASPAGRYPKLLSTTGSVTVRNSTNSKAGKLGDFHHFLGAVVVEVRGSWYTIRQLNCDRATGAFTDLATDYSPSRTRPARRAEALILGDVHASVTDPTVGRVTYAKGGMVATLRPKHIVAHDVFDGVSINPHHVGDPYTKAAKHAGGKGYVRAEVEESCAYLKRAGERGAAVYVVPSNHNDFLRRWMTTHDWRVDPSNAEFFLETAAHMVAGARTSPRGVEYPDPFGYWVGRLAPQVTCLAPRASLELAGVECGMHGHEGPNGTRGTLRNLARIGAKVVTGHTHTPGIEEGHYQVGTSTPLQLDYNRGPSSWMQAHVVIYATGKRAILSIADGRWRL